MFYMGLLLIKYHGIMVFLILQIYERRSTQSLSYIQLRYTISLIASFI